MSLRDGMIAMSGFDNTMDQGLITVLFKLDDKVYERELADFALFENKQNDSYLQRAINGYNRVHSKMDAITNLNSFSLDFVYNFNKFTPDSNITVYSLIEQYSA